MKNTIIFFLSLLLLSSCATTRVQIPDLYTKISVDNVKESCEAVENWQVGVMGLTGVVIRFDDCLGVKSLLIIATDWNGVTTIRDASMKLMALHYTEYLDRSTEREIAEEAYKIHSLKKIKEEAGDGWLTYYYEVTYTMEACDLDTCVE